MPLAPGTSFGRYHVKGLLGAVNIGNASGGTNWPGAGADPETGVVYAQANLSAFSPESVAPPPAAWMV